MLWIVRCTLWLNSTHASSVFPSLASLCLELWYFKSSGLISQSRALGNTCNYGVWLSDKHCISVRHKIYFFSAICSSYIALYCMILVFSFPPSMWINLGTCRMKYSVWRCEISVFVKELESKLLRSQSTHSIFSRACSGCAAEQGFVVVGRPILAKGDHIPP